jgi:hypothetical protein
VMTTRARPTTATFVPTGALATRSIHFSMA